jgi:type II secretory pathway pseudopilin PulG
MLTSSVRRRAFRLVELVVVVGIVALLAGLILPVVLKVREASHRIASENNLKQIALATINCADTNGGKLPRPDDAAYPYEKGELAADGKPQKTGYGPPFFHIIPYIECTNLYHDSYADEDGLYLAKRLRGTPYSIYQARDDPTVDRSSDSCSYAVNELAFAAPGGKGYRSFPAGFPDGTSNTLLLAEQYARQYGTRGSGWTEPRIFRPYTEENGKRVPKDPPYQDRPRVGRDSFDGERPQSFRSSGLLVAVADGSVHALSKNEKMWTAKLFYEACTPDGGEWGGCGGGFGADW